MIDKRVLDCLVDQLLETSPDQTGDMMLSAASFLPAPRFDEFEVGRIRALLAASWDDEFGIPIPFATLRELLKPPIRVSHLLAFRKLNHVTDPVRVRNELISILNYLQIQASRLSAPRQRSFLASSAEQCRPSLGNQFSGHSVRDINELVEHSCKYATIYADPPWRYDNSASRGAAANHYPTMTLEEICRLPVEERQLRPGSVR